MENKTIELFTEREKINMASFFVWTFIWCLILKDLHDRGVFDGTYEELIKIIDKE